MIVAILPSKIRKPKRVNVRLESRDRGGTFHIRNLNLAHGEYVAIKKAILKEVLKRTHAPKSKIIVEEIKKC